MLSLIVSGEVLINYLIIRELHIEVSGTSVLKKPFASNKLRIRKNISFFMLSHQLQPILVFHKDLEMKMEFLWPSMYAQEKRYHNIPLIKNSNKFFCLLTSILWSLTLILLKDLKLCLLRKFLFPRLKNRSLFFGLTMNQTGRII